MLGRRHLLRLLQVCERHYDAHRAHRGIDLAPRDTVGVFPIPVPMGRTRRQKVLGGLISEYHGAAA